MAARVACPGVGYWRQAQLWDCQRAWGTQSLQEEDPRLRRWLSQGQACQAEGWRWGLEHVWVSEPLPYERNKRREGQTAACRSGTLLASVLRKLKGAKEFAWRGNTPVTDFSAHLRFR